MSNGLRQIESELAELIAFRDEMQESGEDLAAANAQIAAYVQREIIKVDGVRNFLRYCDEHATMAREEAKRCEAYARSWEAKRDYLKGCVKDAMEIAGKKRLDGAHGYLRLKGNGGLAPLEIREEMVPDELCNYVLQVRGLMWKAIMKVINNHDLSLSNEMMVNAKLERIPDNGLIRAELAKEEAVPGARLGERGQHVEVK